MHHMIDPDTALRLVLEATPAPEPVWLPLEEAAGLVLAEPLHADELSVLTGLPIASVSSALAMMELKGMARQAGGMKDVLARDQRAEYRVE